MLNTHAATVAPLITGIVSAPTLARLLDQTPVRTLALVLVQSLAPARIIVPVTAPVPVLVLPCDVIPAGPHLAPTLEMLSVAALFFATQLLVTPETPPVIELLISTLVCTMSLSLLKLLRLLTYFAALMGVRQTNWRCRAWPSRSPLVSIPSYFLAQSARLSQVC